MGVVTLKSLHNYLKLLENAAELKRRLPTSSNPRSLKEGLYETSRLVGVDAAVFNDPQLIAALIGPQRFTMIRGEPSTTDHVTRIFDSSRVLLTALVDPARYENPNTEQTGAGHQQGGAMAARSSHQFQPKGESVADRAPMNAEAETTLDSLKPMLARNTQLTGRIFRVLFEHMLGFASQSSVQQGSVSLVNDLTGGREHSRSFLSTALFVLGAEIDRVNLVSFMMQHGLYGISLFEHLLLNRDYCDAFHSFRRLQRAFMGSAAAEEAQLRNRLDQFNAQFGGKSYDAKIFEADEHDKVKIDAYLAATDLLEAMALTPWFISLNHAVAMDSTNSIRSVSIIARHFERFSWGEVTRDQTNREIADHLFAFARQFSADHESA
jgi:hypothetical protein